MRAGAPWNLPACAEVKVTAKIRALAENMKQSQCCVGREVSRVTEKSQRSGMGKVGPALVSAEAELQA